MSAQFEPIGSKEFPRPIASTPLEREQRHARRRQHQAACHQSGSFSPIGLGWLKPHMGLPRSFVLAAREVLGR